ncbi:putative high mobility group nucleosome-binding domain-containing protein 5 [Cocos nucifera]|uniref:Putative high mobility group nucleosome-binding domain-containing protein 5 n=1 Tax=Cocos nucifera TaxID=13894 RepID=A0A8K0N5L9_COCNU|nr:putative high mobility group nucleosome-binding domain-containing protein 5 [Cocos nucifera]
MEGGFDSSVATRTGETATPSCKKSDGKGWHCKRPAHLPHSLCQYHLTQLRSYTSNNSHRKASDQATGGGDKHRKKRKADIAGDGNNFYYYYYSGFRPWRGKRRGSSYSSDNFGNVTEEEGRENSESADGHDAPVTGDDEGDSEEDGGKGCCNEEEEEEEEEEERNCRKRGRKPVKARSLKSLL